MPSIMPSIVRPLLLAIAAAIATFGAGHAAQAAEAPVLSAAAADAALGRGALAWDLRATAVDGLPGALRADGAGIRAWLERGDLAALETALSTAGLDLSRDVVVYGEPGDARAQALVESLQPYARGRVLWLVGGAAEWAMTDRPLRPLTARHAPVPQKLVAAEPLTGGAMAAAGLRAARVDAGARAGAALALR